MLLIRNGVVNLNQEWHKVDLLIAEGKIVRIGHTLQRAHHMDEIDAQNKFIIPGLIDMHVHVDDQIGNYYLADTYRSGTEVAIQNGITSFFTFITQKEDESNSDAINRAMRKTDGNLFCNVGFHFTMKSLASMVEFHKNPKDGYACRSIKLYTTYKKAGIYTSYKQMEEYFRYFSGRQVIFLIHCEDEAVLEAISSDFALRTSHFELLDNAFSHTLLRPPAAEVEAIKKVIDLARKYDVRIHIVHVSTAEGIALIEKARSSIKLTCETAPHYLCLNDELLSEPEGNRWLCSPPLRSEQTRKDMRHLAEKGKIDAFATDHCAFSTHDKDENKDDIRNVPNGIAGLGSLPHHIYQMNEKDPKESLLFMSRHLSKNPAKILGIFPHKGIITQNADADICIVDVHGKSRNVQSSLSDTYEPYPKVKSQLHFSHVILKGHPVVKDGKVIDMNNPKGELL